MQSQQRGIITAVVEVLNSFSESMSQQVVDTGSDVLRTCNFLLNVASIKQAGR